MKRSHASTSSSSSSSPSRSKSRRSQNRSFDTMDNSSIFSFDIPSSAFNCFAGLDMSHLKGQLGDFNESCKRLKTSHTQANESLHELSANQLLAKEAPLLAPKASEMSQLYKKALEDTEREIEASRAALDAIYDIRLQAKSQYKKMAFTSNGLNIRRGELMKILVDCANIIPLFVGKSINDKPPPLCGAMPVESNYICKIGDLVAAFIIKHSDNEDNWILAEVVRYNSSTGKYEVDDIDEEEKKHHLLPKRKIIPIPTMRANPETHPEALHPKGTHVLALYPQTTCFYAGIVQDTPKTLREGYKVLFEDNSYPEGYSPALEIPQRYVILFKDVK